MSAHAHDRIHRIIHKYVSETYVNIDYPIIIVDNYYIVDKSDDGYSVVFSATANDCLYIQTGKKFHFTINMQVKNETVTEIGLVCTELTPTELQEITSSPSS